MKLNTDLSLFKTCGPLYITLQQIQDARCSLEIVWALLFLTLKNLPHGVVILIQAGRIIYYNHKIEFMRFSEHFKTLDFTLDILPSTFTLDPRLL